VGTKHVKIVFLHSLRQQWIDLCQINTKMIIGPFYTYHRKHFTTGNDVFL